MILQKKEKLFFQKRKVYLIISLLQESDIILTFSKHESTHLTLFEGLACGAWPLSINWSGIEEFLPSENIFSNDSEFLAKVQSFYSLGDNERARSVKNLSKKTCEEALFLFANLKKKKKWRLKW